MTRKFVSEIQKKKKNQKSIKILKASTIRWLGYGNSMKRKISIFGEITKSKVSWMYYCLMNSIISSNRLLADYLQIRYRFYKLLHDSTIQLLSLPSKVKKLKKIWENTWKILKQRKTFSWYANFFLILPFTWCWAAIWGILFDSNKMIGNT